jgi:hypothetical protein
MHLPPASPQGYLEYPCSHAKGRTLAGVFLHATIMQRGLDLASVSRRPDRRARRSVGQLTVSSRSPFRRRFG